MTSTQQFIIALVVGIPAALSAVGAFTASIVTLVRQGHMRATIEENHKEAQSAVEDVKASVNGVQDKLVAAAKVQGATEQREETEKENIVIQ